MCSRCSPGYYSLGTSSCGRCYSSFLWLLPAMSVLLVVLSVASLASKSVDRLRSPHHGGQQLQQHADQVLPPASVWEWVGQRLRWALFPAELSSVAVRAVFFWLQLDALLEHSSGASVTGSEAAAPLSFVTDGATRVSGVLFHLG